MSPVQPAAARPPFASLPADVRAYCAWLAADLPSGTQPPDAQGKAFAAGYEVTPGDQRYSLGRDAYDVLVRPRAADPGAWWKYAAEEIRAATAPLTWADLPPHTRGVAAWCFGFADHPGDLDGPARFLCRRADDTLEVREEASGRRLTLTRAEVAAHLTPPAPAFKLAHVPYDVLGHVARVATDGHCPCVRDAEFRAAGWDWHVAGDAVRLRLRAGAPVYTNAAELEAEQARRAAALPANAQVAVNNLSHLANERVRTVAVDPLWTIHTDDATGRTTVTYAGPEGLAAMERETARINDALGAAKANAAAPERAPLEYATSGGSPLRWVSVPLDDVSAGAWAVAVGEDGRIKITAPGAGKDEGTMDDDDKPTVVETIKADGAEALWRTAGSQFSKLAREPLCALLARGLGDDSSEFRARVARFLETELGRAIVDGGLSVAALTVPGPVGERLGREMRVRALVGGADALADVVMGPLREIAATTLRGVPELAAVPAALPEAARATVVEMPARAKETAK